MEENKSTVEQKADRFTADEQTKNGFQMNPEIKRPLKFQDTQRIVLTIRFLMMLGFFSPVYYLIIWRKIPNYDIRLIVTGVVGLAVLLLFILTQWEKRTGFEAAKAIPILIIIFGAIVAALICPVGLLDNIFKIFVVLFFSILPGGLYLHFIRTKGKTLEDEYVLNLHRLHIDKYDNLPEPPGRSIVSQSGVEKGDGQSRAENIYLKKFEALFGSAPSDDPFNFATLQDENVWPVAVATLIISVGWILVMKPGALGKYSAAMPEQTVSSYNNLADTRGDLDSATPEQTASSSDDAMEI